MTQYYHTIRLVGVESKYEVPEIVILTKLIPKQLMQESILCFRAVSQNDGLFLGSLRNWITTK